MAIHKKILEWQAAHPTSRGSVGASFGRSFWQSCSGRGEADRNVVAADRVMQTLARQLRVLRACCSFLRLPLALSAAPANHN
jgi:hypothetical protein